MSDEENEESYELDELSVDKIADITGISQDEVKENLDQLKNVLSKPEEVSDEDKELARNMLGKAIESSDTFETARSVVGSILSTEDGAKTSGEVTGATLSTIVEEIPRIADGKANMSEVKKTGTAIVSMVDAFKEGRDISRHVIENLPTKQEIEEEKNTIDVDEVDEGDNEDGEDDQ